MRSAGLLPYRTGRGLEMLIAHPGGPFWSKRDAGVWSVVKGLIDLGEDDRRAALREFVEETGMELSGDGWVPLGETRLKSGKVVVAWAVEADLDLSGFRPGVFMHQGRAYPEIDRIEWVDPATARTKLNPAQVVFVERLEAHLGLNGGQED